ncbi:MAG: L-threonylcarbamoyladenylate synthase [Candidatus Kapaibacterium sp.]
MITTDLEKAKRILDNNQNLIIPTETVYGLAGNIYNTEAINNIYRIKERPSNNPLIVHISSSESLDLVAKDIPEIAYSLADKFWPGALTMVFNKRESISDLITAGKQTVAVRVPNHETTLSLLKSLDYPLAAPSANPFGKVSPTSAAHAYRYFGESVDILDGGKCELGIESTIIGFEEETPVIYRLGSLSLEEIEYQLGNVEIKNHDDNSPIAPGMMLKHYAPTTPLLLTDNIDEAIKNNKAKRIGLLLSQTVYSDREKSTIIVINNKSNRTTAAKNLYSDLHQLDNMNLDLIIAERWEESGLGNAINDRLARASLNYQGIK